MNSIINIGASSNYKVAGNPWAAVMPRTEEGLQATLDSFQASPAQEAAPARGSAPRELVSRATVESLQKTTLATATAAAANPSLCPAIRVILLGAASSCKALQASMLAKEFDVPHLHMGDLIKGEIASGSRLGNLLGKAIAAGNDSPAELLQQLITQRLDEEDVQKGFILDAYPTDLAAKDADALAMKLDDLKIVELADTKACASGSCELPAVKTVRNRGDYYSVDDNGDPQEVTDVLGALAMNFQAPQVSFLRV